jgi:endonuclease I
MMCLVPALLLYFNSTAMICPNPTIPWGFSGHRIVGEIASFHLTEDAEAGIELLLGNQTLADVSTWADVVRNSSSFRWTKKMHYINVPRDATSVDLDRDCDDEECVVAAIRKFRDQILDESLPFAWRVNAAKFLVHFVGDVHQPLHVSYADDKGGNETEVSFFGTDLKLHAIWDTSILEQGMDSSGASYEDYAIELDAEITEQEVEMWSAVTDPTDWANESLAITRNLYPPLESMGSAEHEGALPVVRLRLKQGGIRLAALLNKVFAAEEPDDPIEPIEALFPDLTGNALRTAVLGLITQNQTQLSYKAARQALYWDIDNDHEIVTTIYAREEVILSPGDWPDGNTVLNCEHLWPQSKLQGQTQARSDLYHLRPARPKVNQKRGSLPFGTPVNSTTTSSWLVGEESDGDEVFLPPDIVRGDIARSLFYISVRYGLPIDDDQEEDLKAWHAEDPVDELEHERVERIVSRQGNRNPFVDDPTLAHRLDDY